MEMSLDDIIIANKFKKIGGLSECNSKNQGRINGRALKSENRGGISKSKYHWKKELNMTETDVQKMGTGRQQVISYHFKPKSNGYEAPSEQGGINGYQQQHLLQKNRVLKGRNHGGITKYHWKKGSNVTNVQEAGKGRQQETSNYDSKPNYNENDVPKQRGGNKIIYQEQHVFKNDRALKGRNYGGINTKFHWKKELNRMTDVEEKGKSREQVTSSYHSKLKSNENEVPKQHGGNVFYGYQHQEQPAFNDRVLKGRNHDGITKFNYHNEINSDTSEIPNTGLSSGNSITHLHVSNLDYGISESDIRDLFEDFGVLVNVSLHFNRAGLSLGTADVVFQRRLDAIKAINTYNGVPLDGRPISIQFITSDISEKVSIKSRLGPPINNI